MNVKRVKSRLRRLRVVGGAALSVAVDRETTTTDVDAMYGANSDVENAARTIAYRNGWPENWLNDNVKQFASHFDTADDWINLDVRDGVAIRVAGVRLLLAMKLFAARGRRDSQNPLNCGCGITCHPHEGGDVRGTWRDGPNAMG